MGCKPIPYNPRLGLKEAETDTAQVLTAMGIDIGELVENETAQRMAEMSASSETL